VRGEERHHRLEHPWIDGCRGVVIHVDRKFHRSFLRLADRRGRLKSDSVSSARRRGGRRRPVRR
jgi:hypothetical protein